MAPFDFAQGRAPESRALSERSHEKLLRARIAMEIPTTRDALLSLDGWGNSGAGVGFSHRRGGARDAQRCGFFAAGVGSQSGGRAGKSSGFDYCSGAE